MNKTILTVGAVLCCALLAHAQRPDDSNLPPLPPGELVNKLPTPSKWEVACVYPPDPQSFPSGTGSSRPATGSSQSQPKVGSALDRKMIITKSGETLNEDLTYGDGRRESRWRIGNLEVVFRSTSKTPEVNYGAKAKVEDFPGLSWISHANYAGTDDIDGRKCYVFRDKVKLTEQWKWQGLDYGSAPPLVDAIARIDMAALLPVSVRIGDETRTFQYDPAPTTPLSLPPFVQDTISKINAEVRKTPSPRPKP